MSKTPAIQIVTYVYGVDVTSMDKPALLEALKQVRKDLKELVSGLEGVESAYVTSKIAELESAQTKIVALLDA
jgi:hypothetical protein